MENQSIIIRPLTHANGKALWGILYYAIHVPDGAPPPPREIVHQPQLARYVEDWGKANDLGYGAFAGNKLIGAVWLREWNGDDKGYGFWNDETPELTIALAPIFRGQGIGTRLMESVLDVAAARYRAVSLSVDKRNPAQHLYNRFGFVIVDYDTTSLLMLKQFRT